MSKDTMRQDDFSISDEKSRFQADEGTTTEKKEPKKAPLAKGDTRYVYLSMAIVLLMILITAGIVIGFTFLFLSQEEEDEFQHGFQQQANVIAESSKFHSIAVHASLGAMADSITSFATFTGEKLNYEWPYITVSDFHVRGERALEEAYLEMVAFSPLVTHEDSHEWALYSANNDGWLGGNNGSQGIASEIYLVDDFTGHAEADSETSLMAPIWQTTPKPYDPSLVNYNVLSEPMYSSLFQAMLQVEHLAMSAVYKDGHVARTYFDPVDHDAHHNHHAEHLETTREQGAAENGANNEEGVSGHGEDHSSMTVLHVSDTDAASMHENHGDPEASATVDHGDHVISEETEMPTMSDMDPSGHTMPDETEVPTTVSDETEMPTSNNMNHSDHASMETHGMSKETEIPNTSTVNHTDHASMAMHSISAETTVPTTMDHGDHTSMPTEATMSEMDHSGHRNLESGHSHATHGDSHQAASPDKMWAFTRPHSLVMAPVFDSFDQENRSITGFIHGILAWEFYLTELLPPGISGIVVVLQNSCGEKFTFELEGAHAEFIGDGDLHEQSYDDLYKDVDLASTTGKAGEPENVDQCFYSMRVYPSKRFQATFESDDTEKFVALFAIVFSALALFFFVFVLFVQRRQSKVMGIATRTTDIISNLFPEAVRERIMEQAQTQAKAKAKGVKQSTEEDEEADHNLKKLLQSPSSHLSNDLKSNNFGSDTFVDGIKVLHDAPIADLYPECSVFFADIVGFTAWSSNRSPGDVFVLLETLYGEMDRIATRRRIFKVETIGDCYVAVTGLPNPRKDHGTAMVRFAGEALAKSSIVFNALAPRLGDDTRNLDLRLGIHSGSVTAGVLRGEKGRFQLFGDTVNTAARMESTSHAGSIQCSTATADLLIASGRSSWVTERPDKINPKGKGEMTSYWVHPKTKSEDASQRSGQLSNTTDDETIGTGVSQNFTSRSFSRDPSLSNQRMDSSSFEAAMEC